MFYSLMKSCNRGFIGHITQMDHLVTRPKSKPKLLRQYLKYYNIYGNIYVSRSNNSTENEQTYH